jgi:hypothetical protein
MTMDLLEHKPVHKPKAEIITLSCLPTASRSLIPPSLSTPPSTPSPSPSSHHANFLSPPLSFLLQASQSLTQSVRIEVQTLTVVLKHQQTYITKTGNDYKLDGNRALSSSNH